MSSLSRRERRAQAEAFINNVSGQSYPNSNKIYIKGEIHDIQVGMREITVGDTFVGGTEENPIFEPNEPINVYDTSGAYTDPNVKVNVHEGLPKLRAKWIAERGDTEALAGASSGYSQQRLSDEGLDHIRFENLPQVFFCWNVLISKRFEIETRFLDRMYKTNTQHFI